MGLKGCLQSVIHRLSQIRRNNYQKYSETEDAELRRPFIITTTSINSSVFTEGDSVITQPRDRVPIDIYAYRDKSGTSRPNTSEEITAYNLGYHNYGYYDDSDDDEF